MRSVQAMRLLAALLLAGAALPAPAAAQQQTPRLPLTGAPSAGALAAGAAPARAAPPAAAAPGTAAAPAAPAEQLVDGIAAVVNKDVITLRELDLRTQQARQDLEAQKIPVPDDTTLRRQVLQRLITERVEDQEAARMNIRVSDEQVQQAVQGIAERNKISVEGMREQIEAGGTNWQDYLDVLRRDIKLDRMRQRTVDNTITISDAEVDAYLKEQAARRAAPVPAGAPAAPAGQPDGMALAQILVRVPEGSSPDQVAALRRKAEELLQRARGGEDFAALAAASSDGPEALEGGSMGMRALDGWPDLFLQATRDLQAGQVSDLVQSGNGFHILKVVQRTGPGPQAAAAGAPGDPQAQAGAPTGPMPVTQTRARHILIRTSAVVSDEQARQRLAQLRERILQGESFADLARRYSNDATAPQGGELGWLSPGATVPPFEQAMDALADGEISQPVQSPFGWHLIQVEERRTQDMAEEYQRMQARQALFERRAQPAFEDWLQQLRDQAYIDNRLERREQLEQSL